MADEVFADGTVLPGILCSECGYDLRGLQQTGCCPECGRSVMRTFISLHARRQEMGVPLEDSGVAWLTQASEGVLLTLISTGLTLLLIVLPDGLFERHTFGRQCMLGLVCTSWVLGLYGCWKMARRAKHPQTSRNVIRLLIFLYFCTPYLFGWIDSVYSNALSVPLFVLCAINGLIIPSVMLSIWSKWFRRAGYFNRAWLLELFLAIAPFNMLFQLGLNSSSSYDQSSLRYLMELPLPMLGCPSLFHELRRFVNYPSAWPWLAVPLTLAAVYVLVSIKIYKVLLRARSRATEIPRTL